MKRAFMILTLTAFILVGYGPGFAQEEPVRKSYGAALGMSAILPGSGTIYAGKTTRGIVELGIAAFSVGLIVAYWEDDSWGFSSPALLGVTIYPVVWLVSMIDAPLAVRSYNREHGSATVPRPAHRLALAPPRRNLHLRLGGISF